MGWSLAVVVVLVGVLGSTGKRAEEDPPTNEVNSKLESIRDSAFSLNNCRGRRNQLLRRVFLNNRTISCNDGSPAGYYIRKSSGNRRWVIYLEGGWYCFDLQSCHNRWTRLRSLMTSRLWPEIRHGGGILSSDPEENPYLWNANHVLIPYCSSDSWSGAFYPKTPDQLAFLGSEIILEVIHQLVPYGISSARKVYLVGSSAGGTGVMINLDRVAHALRRWGSMAEVRGIADSGWFLDNEPFNPIPCTDAHTCKPTEAVKLGFKFWNGQLPESCRAQHPADEWWKCYFGYRVYPTLQTPLFIFQWQFDEAQMTADNVGTPVTKSQWDYIHRMGYSLRKSLENVTATFAPSCISHVVLSKRDWNTIKINDISLPQAIWCWEEYNNRSKRRARKLQQKIFNKSSILQPNIPLRHKQRKRVSNRRNLRLNTSSTALKRKHKRKNKGRNRRRHEGNVGNDEVSSSTKRTNKKMVANRMDFSQCSLRLVDECTWPQCNRACPKLRNPFTGEEMDFIELLKSFGLDMKSVATALGTDVETLQTMGNDHLLNILTQTTSK